MKRRIKTALLLATIGLLVNQEAFACATCYGESDSNMATGVSWGILTLMVVVYCVLIGIASFFGYLIYRSHKMASLMDPESASPTDAVQPEFNNR